MSARYRHTQIGYLVLTVILATAVLNAWIALTIGWRPMFIIVGVVLLAVAILFSTLTVAVGDGMLECRLGPGLIQRRFALEEVREARPARSRWYYGWGIRWTPNGWMWNVSGLDVVEVTTADGKVFRIGTDQPAELTAAIRQAIA